VLPQMYQRFITHEINRILRDLAGICDKKDSPASPLMQHSNQSHGTISSIALDTSSPLIHTGGTSMARRNSTADYTSDMETPFRGKAH
jgi:WNK lysine deficient protein kinase